jgi:long-chain fatty acid transport protein
MVASLFALGAWLPGPSQDAAASGFAAARFGGELGNVTATNATALYFNPAGIAYATGFTLFADGLLALRHATWEHPPTPADRPDPPGGEGANIGRATLFNVFAGPMLGATAPIGRLTIAAGIFAPFGGRAHWNQNDRFKGDPNFPLAADGVQRWHGIDGALTVIYFSLGAAYRVGRIAFGASANLIRSSVTTTQARNPTGNGDVDTAREGRTTLDVSGWQGSFGAGVMVEAVQDRLWIGLGYQAQPGLGPSTLGGTLVTDYQGGSTQFPVDLHQALPDSLRVGLRYRLGPTNELRLSGELTRWSVMQTQCVGLEGGACTVTETGADATAGQTVLQNLTRHWRDTFGIRAGASHWLVPTVELFAGLGIETGAVPDETLDPGLADADNLAAALGGRFQVWNTVFVAASYTHIQYRDRDNTGRSQLATRDGTDVQPPTRRPDGGGKYTQWIGLFNLNVEKRF